MGRLDKQGLSRFANNIKEFINNSILTVKNDILSVKNNLNKVETDLGKTENTKYSTENGVKEFECKDGYVDNVVIEGETLVNFITNPYVCNLSETNGNIWPNADFGRVVSFSNNVWSYTTGTKDVFDDFGQILSVKPNTTYTFITNIVDCANSAVNLKIGQFSAYPTENVLNANAEIWLGAVGQGAYIGNDYRKFVFTTKENCVAITCCIQCPLVSTTYQFSNLMLLEGDYSNIDIPYFEGLKSVGQGDKIEVLSYEKDSNLFDNCSYILNTGINSTTGEVVPNNYDWKISQPIKLKSNTEYTFSKKDLDGQKAYVFFYNNNKIEPSSYCYSWVKLDDTKLSEKFTTSDSSQYGVIVVSMIYDSKVSIVEGNSNEYTDYYKADKKQISTTLRSLPNGVKDTIEKRGNKYVKVQRCGEVALNGSENWKQITTVSANTISSALLLTDCKGDAQHSTVISNIYCDKFKPSYPSSRGTDEEMATIANFTSEKQLFIRIAKSKLATQDVEGFKTWLKSNPTTIVYELETPQIIELPNFNPQTYEGGTTLVLNSGAIQANAEFEVTNSMGSEIEVLKDKVSSLDDYVREDEVYYPTYVNGWGSAYPDSDVNYIRRIGNICFMYLSIKNPANIEKGSDILRIPTHLRPKYLKRVIGMMDYLNQSVIIYTDGRIVLSQQTNFNVGNKELRIQCWWEVE